MCVFACVCVLDRRLFVSPTICLNIVRYVIASFCWQFDSSSLQDLDGQSPRSIVRRGEGERAASGKYHPQSWIAVKELGLSYHDMVMYIISFLDYGNLI